MKSDAPHDSLTPAQPTEQAVRKNNHQRATEGRLTPPGSWLPSNCDVMGPVSTLLKASQVISGKKRLLHKEWLQES